jgi:hypothetical protein
MENIWKTSRIKPPTRSLIVVIDKKGKIYDFGFFDDTDEILPGQKWAFIRDLVEFSRKKTVFHNF